MSTWFSLICCALTSQGVEVSAYPAEMQSWQRRAEWLSVGFKSAAKHTRSAVQEILQFLNGDTQSPKLIHWCKAKNGEPCCVDDSASWNRVAALLVGFFSKGYPVPLLYRMKHYAPAAAYIRFGCCLHNILPRILSEEHQHAVKSADQPGSHMAELVDALLAEPSHSQSHSGGALNQSDFNALVSKLLDEDVSYSAQNSARKQMVEREIAKPAFHQSSIMIDMLVQPMEHGINSFLRRTKLQHELQYLSHGHPNHEKFKEECRSGFLKLVHGTVGRMLIRDYMNLLRNGLEEAMCMGLDGSQQQLNLLFQMVVSCMCDLERRLVREYTRNTPFTLLALTDVDPKTFVLSWQKLYEKFSKCQQCVDAEFTAAFLNAYQFSVPFTEGQLKDIQEVQSLLLELAVWSPVTSDSVEIVNGQAQWAVSRRGSQYIKQGRSAVETTFLGSAVKQHSWLAWAVGRETLPGKNVASRVRRQAGTTSSNQFTKRDEDWEPSRNLPRQKPKHYFKHHWKGQGLTLLNLNTVDHKPQ